MRLGVGAPFSVAVGTETSLVALTTVAAMTAMAVEYDCWLATLHST